MSETKASPSFTGPRECAVLQAAKPYVGKQGFTYAPAVSAQTVGAAGIHMQLITMPPGARAKAHMHAAHETAIYVLSGESGTWYGDRLEHHVIARAGDFLYMPPGVPHLPYNLSQAEPVTAVIARTDPNDQESVIMLPELDVLHSA